MPVSGSVYIVKALNRPQYSRLRRILEIIREGTNTGCLPNAGDFMAECEVSRRTVRRDMDFLRDDECAPVEYDGSRKGYYLSDKTWNLPPVQISHKEAFAFVIARRLIERFRGTPLDMDMRSVLDKIGESLDGFVTLDVGSLASNFSVLCDDYVEQDPETWKAVAGCVERRECMEITYQKFNGETRKYDLEPLHLISYHGNWYILAQNTAKDRLTTYAVSRIKAMKATGRYFKVPRGFKVEDHVEKAFGIVRGDEVMGVRLVFAPTVAAYIRERVWHPSQKIIERRDGGIELRMKTAGWKELVRWILSWQPDVKVLAPVKLRRRIKEKMQQALAASR
jgi:predicted DNA-binding transcriptional regulator YafY